MNNLDQIEAKAKQSKALRERTPKGPYYCNDMPYSTIVENEAGPRAEIFEQEGVEDRHALGRYFADAHNAKLDEYCLLLCKEVRQLRELLGEIADHCDPYKDCQGLANQQKRLDWLNELRPLRLKARELSEIPSDV